MTGIAAAGCDVLSIFVMVGVVTGRGRGDARGGISASFRLEEWRSVGVDTCSRRIGHDVAHHAGDSQAPHSSQPLSVSSGL